MPEANKAFPELGSDAQRVLREALRALEIYKANELIGDVSKCPTTERVRTLARSAVTVRRDEQIHIRYCSRCRARIQAFQSAMSTTPRHKLEHALLTAREQMRADPRDVGATEQKVRHVFEFLQRGGETDVPPSCRWNATSELAHHLRAARKSAASAGAIEHLILAFGGAMSAAVCDVLSACSRDFDRAWPIVEILRRGGNEAARIGAHARCAYAGMYACLLVAAPTYLQSALAFGISLFPAVIAQEIAAEALRLNPGLIVRVHIAVAAEVGVLDCGEWEDAVAQRIAPQVAAFRAAAQRLRDEFERGGQSPVPSDRVRAILDSLLVSLFEGPAATLQLIVVSQFMSLLVETADENHALGLVQHAYGVVLEHRRRTNGSAFLAVEACRPLLRLPDVYAALLSDMVAENQPELYQAAVVALSNVPESNRGLQGFAEVLCRLKAAVPAYSWLAESLEWLDRTSGDGTLPRLAPARRS